MPCQLLKWGNSMSSITQYETKVGKKFWRCQYTVSTDPLTGKQKRTSKRGFKTRKECEIYLSRALNQIDRHGYSTDQNITYNKAYEYFISSYQNTVKESTLHRVLGLFKHHILPILGKYEVKKITVPMCQEAVNKWASEMKSFGMIKDYANLVFVEAKRLKAIYENPMEMIVMPKKKSKIGDEKLTNYWTKSQVKSFFSELDCRCKGTNEKAIAMFRLSFFTGMRKGELLALQISDIDFDNKTLAINKTVSRGIDGKPIITVPKTKNSIRTIGLDDTTCTVMNNWINELRKEMFILGYNIDTMPKQLLFPNTQNHLLGLTKMNRWLGYIIESYNKNKSVDQEPLNRINVHGIRHTVCSLMLESGSSIKDVQLQLGHSDTSQILNVYWHVSNKTQRNTVNKLASFVGL